MYKVWAVVRLPSAICMAFLAAMCSVSDLCGILGCGAGLCLTVLGGREVGPLAIAALRAGSCLLVFGS